MLNSESNGRRCSLPSGTTNIRLCGYATAAMGCSTASYSSFAAWRLADFSASHVRR